VTEPPFSIVPLNDHDRSGFSCGVEPLNTYFQKQANQDMKRQVAACFVALEKATGLIAGYYTLSACHVYLDALDEDWRRKLPRYPTVPAVRLGRLAIDSRFQGQKLGSALLANAVARTFRSEIATNMMVVDAKNEDAAAFYQHHGFRPDPKQPLCLYAPLARILVSLGLA
jgi:ribosomal protein S18 acetylase RimI-like enzyme